MIDTVLLDAGGVILDETEFERVRGEIAVEVLAPIVPGYDIERYWADVRGAVDCYSPRVYRYLVWKHCADDMATFDDLWARYHTLCKERDPGHTLMPGIGEVLADLSSDFSLVIAGQYGRSLLDLLEQHDLLRYLSSRITQDDFGITKPDPRYYEQILARSGRVAERSVMVGDRIDNDVIPAKAVGMRTIRVRTGIHAAQRYRTPDETPDIEVSSVAELPDAVRRLAETERRGGEFDVSRSQ